MTKVLRIYDKNTRRAVVPFSAGEGDHDFSILEFNNYVLYIKKGADNTEGLIEEHQKRQMENRSRLTASL